MPTDNTLIGREYYAFRDAVHNLIFIEDPNLGVLFRTLLDTYEFQRLRRVRQNGLASFVYPSLEGTRFPHSVGSFAVAKRVAETLQQEQPGAIFGFPKALNIEEASLHGFAIAASLHDIGHGPLSHSWELIDDAIKEAFSEHIPHKHEEAGVDLILSENTDIGRTIATLRAKSSYHESVLNSAILFLKKQHHLTYLRPLLSGNLDIDRLDYISRDTKNAGVTYGNHELEWLIRSMRFGRLTKPAPTLATPWVIAIDARKGANALIQYLRARENMYGLVYLHKTIRAANWQLASILVHATALMRQGRIRDMGLPLLQFLNGLGQGTNVLPLDDTDVWSALKGTAQVQGEPFLSHMAQQFLSRKFYKSRQVSSKTAYFLEKMIKSNAFAEQVQGRLHNQYPEIFDTPLLSRALTSKLVARVDSIEVDIIGKEKGPEEETWIMYRRPTDIGLMSLRDYWIETIGSNTKKDYSYVHYLKDIEQDVLEVVARLEGQFPQIQSVSAKEDAAIAADLVSTPVGFEIQRELSNDGAHKTAYLGVYVAEDADGTFNCGEPYVLKRYRTLSTEISSALFDCVNRIYKIDSLNLSQAFPRRVSPDSPLWLIERLWISDLLRLIEETGIRRNPHFLLRMGSDLATGLADLAARDIRHGDIKLENCGIVSAGGDRTRFVLGDFGASSANPTKVPTEEAELGTLKTRPPELLVSASRRRIGPKSDVWALSATIFAAATGSYPFIPLRYDRAERKLKAEALEKSLSTNVGHLETKIDAELPPIIGNILRKGLNPILDDRSTADDLLVAFNGAIEKCVLPPKDSLSEPGSGYNVLFWQRALDLVDICNFAKANQLPLDNAVLDECTQLLAVGEQWIPAKLLKQLSQLVTRGEQ